MRMLIVGIALGVAGSFAARHCMKVMRGEAPCPCETFLGEGRCPCGRFSEARDESTSEEELTKTSA